MQSVVIFYKCISNQIMNTYSYTIIIALILSYLARDVFEKIKYVQFVKVAMAVTLKLQGKPSGILSMRRGAMRGAELCAPRSYARRLRLLVTQIQSPASWDSPATGTDIF